MIVVLHCNYLLLPLTPKRSLKRDHEIINALHIYPLDHWFGEKMDMGSVFGHLLDSACYFWASSQVVMDERVWGIVGYCKQ